MHSSILHMPRFGLQRLMKNLLLLIMWLLLSHHSSVSAQWTEPGIDDSDMADDLEEALTFQKYPTYTQYVKIMQGFARDYPEICMLDTFGTSIEGRLLLALKISDHVKLEEAEARFFYTSSMHGDELVGYNLLMRLADDLLKGYGNDSELTGLVDSLAIWINPLANPDGSYYPDSNNSLTQSRRKNREGRDLNRDFPDPSKGEADDTTGRAHENKAMMQFLHRQRFTLSANIHSGAEVVNYPWDHTYDLHADDAWYHFIAREYADEAKAVDPSYMALFTDGITQGAEWYPIYGGRQDYVNYYLGGREVTLELSRFYRLGSEYLEEYWHKNRRSLLNYMAQCTYGIRGRVRSLDDGSPLAARIFIPGHDSSYSVIESSPGHGDFYRLIKEGTYDLVVSADGYLSDTLNGVEVQDYQATWIHPVLTPLGSSRATEKATAPLLIWPNPADQYAFLEPGHLPSGSVTLFICSLDGQVISRQFQTCLGGPIRIDTGQFSNGCYLVRVMMGDKSLHGRLMVIHHH